MKDVANLFRGGPRPTAPPKPETLVFVVLAVVLSLGGMAPAVGQEVLESQGLRFRLIPGGRYFLGSPLDEPGRYAGESDPYQVSLKAFYLAETETTNSQYARFLKATGHPPPLYWQDKNLNAPTQPVANIW